MNLLTLTCTNCARYYRTTREANRALVESGRLPRCPRCAFWARADHQKTARASVLAAAAALPARGFRLADLVLAAWQADPLRFGLDGHEGEYPDSNRVICEVVRATKAGQLERVAEKQYRVPANRPVVAS